MNKSRMEAFSDGLFAVVITIMVLELNAPMDEGVKSLAPLIPIFLSYVLSFIYGAIFWINHHHLLAATRKINGPVLWANLNFLFWLSLIPFFTAWVDENHAAAVPIAFIQPYVSLAIYVIVALVWFMPERALERALAKKDICEVR